MNEMTIATQDSPLTRRREFYSKTILHGRTTLLKNQPQHVGSICRRSTDLVIRASLARVAPDAVGTCPPGVHLANIGAGSACERLAIPHLEDPEAERAVSPRN